MESDVSDNTMRAARFHAYGPPDELVVDTVPRPEPQEGEVLVQVHAAGVNPIDWKFRAGYLKDFMPLALPYTPGIDLAGIVEGVGPGVTTFQRGQAVFGRGAGTYAEYAVAPAGNLAPKPSNLTFDQAATVPVGGVTAWLGLFDVAGLQSGQRLLVHGPPAAWANSRCNSATGKARTYSARLRPATSSLSVPWERRP
jgi:NADPH:quinone reductase-like Zn-dependent oxidoreductase